MEGTWAPASLAVGLTQVVTRLGRRGISERAVALRISKDPQRDRDLFLGAWS